MMHHVNAMLDRHASMYTLGGFAAATQFYTFPLAVHVQQDLLVKPTRADFEQALRRMVEAYKARGVLEVKWTISAIDLPRGGRFRVWTAWHHFYTHRVQADACHVVQFCRIQNGRLSVEMIHFLDSRLIPAANDTAALLRSA